MITPHVEVDAKTQPLMDKECNFKKHNDTQSSSDSDSSRKSYATVLLESSSSDRDSSNYSSASSSSPRTIKMDDIKTRLNLDNALVITKRFFHDN